MMGIARCKCVPVNKQIPEILILVKNIKKRERGLVRSREFTSEVFYEKN